MPNEHYLMNEIRAWCGKHDILCFRCNVGGGPLANGGYFNSGLPKGFPDLILLPGNGQIIFVECKTLKGKQREEQINFEAQVVKRGYKYILARSLDQTINNIYS